jgi:hypothetical protein
MAAAKMSKRKGLIEKTKEKSNGESSLLGSQQQHLEQRKKQLQKTRQSRTARTPRSPIMMSEQQGQPEDTPADDQIMKPLM